MRFLLLTALLAGCGGQTDDTSTLAIRDLTEEEAVQDFRQMVSAVRTHYGPLEFKEARYGYKLDSLAADYETRIRGAKSDAAVFGLFKQFLARFEDGHVGIEFPNHPGKIEQYRIPLFVTPLEGKAIVADVNPELDDLGITVGDELVSIDGKAPFDLLKAIKRYEAFGQDESEAHWIYQVLYRPFYNLELVPTESNAHLVLKRQDGDTYSADASWRVDRTDTDVDDLALSPAAQQFRFHGAQDFNEAAGATLLNFANVKPFFATDQVVEKFGLAEVKPSPSFLRKYGVDPAKAPEIYAALYRYEGKTLLIVRQAGYSTENAADMLVHLKTYKAILDQYEELADALVVEQTHNPGGAYCQEFFRLFITEEQNGFVQFDNTDRAWLRDLRGMWPELLGVMIEDAGPEWKRQFQLMAAELERDYDAGLPISARPQPVLGGFNKVKPFADYSWRKPLLVLVDELAGSCGDLFPMLIKHNAVAKIFGRQPMGLGGNVEEVTKLHNSGAGLRLTRGLYTSYREDGQYPSTVLIENQGVRPDYEHTNTVADFLAGWTGYVDAFSKVAIQQ